jgi:hypothetical protein
MSTAWGIIVASLALLAWGGQTISWVAPDTAARLGLTESEDSVDRTFFADGRGEAFWDTFTLWTMLAAGVLLVMDHSWWPYFGLMGGGMFVYFGGRGIASRRLIQQAGLSVGTPKTVGQAYLFLAIWGAVGLITIVAAIVALQSRS